MPSTQHPTLGHPGCCFSNEESEFACLGGPNLVLIQHKTEDGTGDVYCAACWSSFLTDHPDLEGSIVGPIPPELPELPAAGATAAHPALPAVGATAALPAPPAAGATVATTLGVPAAASKYAATLGVPAATKQKTAAESPSSSAAADASGRATGVTHWEVETDDGWQPWEPWSNSLQRKEFDAPPGSETFHTSWNGKHKYHTRFLSHTDAMQTIVKTGRQRRLRVCLQ